MIEGDIRRSAPRSKNKSQEEPSIVAIKAARHRGFFRKTGRCLERVAGIEPAYSAWKAAALPLSYTRGIKSRANTPVVEEAGFEPAYAKRTDLQSVSFNHSDTPPTGGVTQSCFKKASSAL